jgi:hypothetical protein
MKPLLIRAASVAPIRAGGASPLRVATGGDANWRFVSSSPPLAGQPASPNRRREERFASFPRNTARHSLRPTEVDSWFANYKKFLLCSPHDTQYESYPLCGLPRLEQKSLAANVSVFTKQTT